MSEAVQHYLDALTSIETARAQHRLRRLHRLRAAARLRLTALKRQRRVQTYDDLIQRVAQALDGPHRLALVRSCANSTAWPSSMNFKIPTWPNGASFIMSLVIPSTHTPPTSHPHCF